jgi:hypothetical protein
MEGESMIARLREARPFAAGLAIAAAMAVATWAYAPPAQGGGTAWIVNAFINKTQDHPCWITIRAVGDSNAAHELIRGRVRLWRLTPAGTFEQVTQKEHHTIDRADHEVKLENIRVANLTHDGDDTGIFYPAGTFWWVHGDESFHRRDYDREDAMQDGRRTRCAQ